MTLNLITADINQSVSRMMRNNDRSANHPTNSKVKSKFPFLEEVKSLDHLKQQLKIYKESLSKLGISDEVSPEEQQFQAMICRSFCQNASMKIDFMERQQQYEDYSMKVFRQQDLFRRNKKQDLRIQLEEGDLLSDIGIDVQDMAKCQEGDKT